MPCDGLATGLSLRSLHGVRPEAAFVVAPFVAEDFKEVRIGGDGRFVATAKALQVRHVVVGLQQEVAFADCAALEKQHSGSLVKRTRYWRRFERYLISYARVSMVKLELRQRYVCTMVVLRQWCAAVQFRQTGAPPRSYAGRYRPGGSESC